LQGLRQPFDHKRQVCGEAERFHAPSVAKVRVGIVKG
jgi:hypothetical protein